MPVKIIKATGAQPTSASLKKLRVAAYCRVSTDSDEQESSYEAQCEHYTALINSNTEWKMAGVFADSGISGTSTKHREQFNKMIAKCKAGRVDLILTKSISRFARNTVDCLKYIRLLKDMNIPVLFEKESINTMDAKGEVLITIMASIAQQESQNISENVRLGHRYRMQQGKGILNTACYLGFDKDRDGKLIIVPNEADLVRRIYREYLEGWSPLLIAQRLMDEGIPAPKGGSRWHTTTIRGMLQNEKYTGVLLMQKYYTESFLTHKMVKNDGKYPKYLVENHHDPIVPKEIFHQVQGEFKRRGALVYPYNRFGNRLALNGKLFCGKCGEALRHNHREDGQDTWRQKRSHEGPCTCWILKEAAVHRAVETAFEQLPAYQDRLERLRAWHRKELARADLSEQERLWLIHGETQLRFLLDWMEPKEAPPSDTPACTDPEDFFARTACYHPPFNDLVNRFIRAVTVREQGFVVCFRAGLCICINV